MSKCRVCGTEDKDKQMCFQMTDACCENHRKVIAGELLATYNEVQLMDKALMDKLYKAGKLEHIRGF